MWVSSSTSSASRGIGPRVLLSAFLPPRPCSSASSLPRSPSSSENPYILACRSLYSLYRLRSFSILGVTFSGDLCLLPEAELSPPPISLRALPNSLLLLPLLLCPCRSPSSACTHSRCLADR